MSEKPQQNNKSSKVQSRRRRFFRKCLRVLRVAILLVLLTIVTTFFYFNKVGLPDFVKKRVISALRAKGWDLQFSQLRLRWSRGLVADNVYLEARNRPNSPHVFVENAACKLDYGALFKLRFVPISLLLNGGRIVWPLSETNQTGGNIQINDVQGTVDLRVADRWVLQSLSAEVMGTRVQAMGIITNASLVRDWKWPGAESEQTEQSSLLAKDWPDHQAVQICWHSHRSCAVRHGRGSALAGPGRFGVSNRRVAIALGGSHKPEPFRTAFPFGGIQ